MTIEIKVDDMRARNKAGYVAKILANGEKQFCSVAEYSRHGDSCKKLTYNLTEDGVYEICDANFGGRQRRINFIKIEQGEITLKADSLSEVLSNGLELPELLGTKAQIDWARNLRDKYIAKLKTQGKEIPCLDNYTSAAWWINNRSKL